MQNYLPLAGLTFDPTALGLNALVPYYSMFPVSFPLKHLGQARAGEWVLDPFCGRGTTNYVARLLGLPTVAVDCNPVAVAITEAKMADVGRRFNHRRMQGDPLCGLCLGSRWECV